jgi:RNA polymerase sigma-70 factor (ECF subfamily)
VKVLECGEARDLASDLIDGELEEELAAAVKHHVATCPTCPALYRAMVQVHSRLVGLRDSPGRAPG